MENLYLRDASILLNLKEISYSNNVRRLEKTFRICEKNKLNIQITIDKSFYLKNHKRIGRVIKKYNNKIRYITIHLTTTYANLFSDDLDTKKFVEKFCHQIKKTKKIIGICVHPDHVKSWRFLKKLKMKKNYLAIEVTDKKARYGNEISHLEFLLKKYKFLKLVIDTSHIKELSRHKFMTFEKVLKKFNNKIVEAQISDFGNFYKSKSIKTTHSLLHLKKDKKIFNQIKLLKERNKKIIFTIEGLLPYGNKTNSYLMNEMRYINQI